MIGQHQQVLHNSHRCSTLLRANALNTKGVRTRFNDLAVQSPPRCDAVNVGVRRRFRPDLTQFLHNSESHLSRYMATFPNARRLRPPTTPRLLITRASLYLLRVVGCSSLAVQSPESDRAHRRIQFRCIRTVRRRRRSGDGRPSWFSLRDVRCAAFVRLSCRRVP